jgi:arylsulfatase A-like enzyme
MLAEMDHNVGQLLDAVNRLGIRDNTIVIFASDNGPEFVRPWDGWAGPWRGQYFTAWEGGIRVPFMIRWPGKIPAGRVSDEIVHGVDLFPTLASIAGANVPNDRPIDGVDQSSFFQGKSEKSARDGILIWCADRLHQPAGRRRQDGHRYLGYRPGAENGGRVRSEHKEASADRHGHARSVRAAEVREVDASCFRHSRHECDMRHHGTDSEPTESQ